AWPHSWQFGSENILSVKTNKVSIAFAASLAMSETLILNVGTKSSLCFSRTRRNWFIVSLGVILVILLSITQFSKDRLKYPVVILSLRQVRLSYEPSLSSQTLFC